MNPPLIDPFTGQLVCPVCCLVHADLASLDTCTHPTRDPLPQRTPAVPVIPGPAPRDPAVIPWRPPAEPARWARVAVAVAAFTAAVVLVLGLWALLLWWAVVMPS